MTRVSNEGEIKDKLFELLDLFESQKLNLAEYKAYVITMVFLKWVSDNFNAEYNLLIEKYKNVEIAKDRNFHQFVIPEGSFWENIKEVNVNIGDYLNNVLKKITAENKEKIEDLFSVAANIDFNNKKKFPDSFLNEIITKLSPLYLGKDKIDSNDLGYIFREFIDEIATRIKEDAKRFATPIMISKLLVGLLQPQQEHKIHDPVVCTGSFLIDSAQFIEKNDGNLKHTSFSGQEIDWSNWMTGKINLFVHGLDDATLRQGDTLLNPKFLDNNGKLEEFDIVLAHPQFSEEWDNDSIKDGDKWKRFEIGIPPKSNADYAFILHILSTLNHTGRAGLVMSNGTLFRGGSEGKIREELIKKDLIEGVITLPEKIFPGAGVPGTIILFNKDKTNELKNKIFFIYAEKDYEAGSNRNFLREEDNNKIIMTFQKKEEIEKYSRLVGIEEIEENEYNLNLGVYIDYLEPEEPVDINEVVEAVSTLNKERADAEELLNKHLKELGYKEIKKIKN